MAKFAQWKDIFDWNKRLMEFDWNDGQSYVVEHKIKKDQFEFKNTAKVGEMNNGHKVGLETKMKFDIKELGGMDGEMKIKNSGELIGEVKSDYLKQFEGFDGVQLMMKSTMGAKQTPMKLGLGVSNSSFIGQWLLETAGTNGMYVNGSYRISDWATFGWEKSWKSATNPMGDVAWSCAFAAKAGNMIQYGIGMGGYSETMASTKLNDATMYFRYDTDKWCKGLTAGSQMKYDMATKKFDTKMGLWMHMDDHSWKFRFHDTGLARIALQWKLHPSCKCTVNTGVDLKDAFNGKVNKMPVGAVFELGY